MELKKAKGNCVSKEEKNFLLISQMVNLMELGFSKMKMEIDVKLNSLMEKLIRNIKGVKFFFL